MAHYYNASSALTANGGANGIIQVAATASFRIGALVSLSGTGLPGLTGVIKAIPDTTHIWITVLNPTADDGGSSARPAASQDCSAYTTALSSTITMAEQDVTSVERAVHAIGGIDPQGRPVTLMLSASGQISGVSIANVSGNGSAGTPDAGVITVQGIAGMIPLQLGAYQADLTVSAGAGIITTSTSDSSVVLGAGLYWLVVSGVPAYINSGAVATSANLLYPVGSFSSEPVYLAAATYHALTASGTGQVAFIPATRTTH